MIEGLVLGRFQPLHPGHLEMIGQAFGECDRVVVCIGSAQRSEPFTIEQRHGTLQASLEANWGDRSWRIVDLVDPEPMEVWPEYVSEQCALEPGAPWRFYRADPLETRWLLRLERLGFQVVAVERKPFWYRGPDGIYRLLSSATEIKQIHAQLGTPLR